MRASVTAPARIQQLASRLHQLYTVPPPAPDVSAQEPQTVADDSRFSRRATIEERLVQMHTAEQARLRDRTRLEDERAELEEDVRRAPRDFQFVEEEAALDLSHERSMRKEVEARLLRHIDERFSAVQRQLAREKREREEAEERFASELGETFAKIVEGIEEERYERQRRFDDLTARHALEMRRLHDELARERELRAKAAAEMVHLLEQLSSSVRSELTIEKQGRQGTEATVMRLLEEALGRRHEQQLSGRGGHL